MATLNNPIQKSNIADRFADFITATANAGIVYGTNNLPRDGSYVFSSTYFGGQTSGIPAATFTGSGTNITADELHNFLMNTLLAYSKIRNVSYVLTITGGGGNTGSYPTAGDRAAISGVSHLSDTYRQATTPARAIFAGNTISSSGLESFMTTVRDYYSNTLRPNTLTFKESTCHASCHSSCHSSRGRR